MGCQFVPHYQNSADGFNGALLRVRHCARAYRARRQGERQRHYGRPDERDLLFAEQVAYERRAYQKADDYFQHSDGSADNTVFCYGHYLQRREEVSVFLWLVQVLMWMHILRY